MKCLLLRRLGIISGALLATLFGSAAAFSILIGLAESFLQHGLTVGLFVNIFASFDGVLLLLFVLATSGFALVSMPLLAVIAWAEAKSIRKLWIHVGVALVFGLLIVPTFGGDLREDPTRAWGLVILMTTTTTVGACVYWALAGRFAGRWRDTRD